MSIENDVDKLINNLVDRITECEFSENDDLSNDGKHSNRDELDEAAAELDHEENAKTNSGSAGDFVAIGEELDRKNPAYVPKRGGFYEHDPRFDNSDDAQVDRSDSNKAKTSSSTSSKTYVDKLRKWKHDMFDVGEQSPKSRNQLFHEYGYDVQRNKDRNKQTPFRPNDRQNSARYSKNFPTPVVSETSNVSSQQQRNFGSGGSEQSEYVPTDRPCNDIPFKKALNPRFERRKNDHAFRNRDPVDTTQQSETKQISHKVDYPKKKMDNFCIPKKEFCRRVVVNSEYTAVEQSLHQQQPQRYNVPPRFAKNARNFGSTKSAPPPSNNNRTVAIEEEEDVAEVEENVTESCESSIQYAGECNAAAAQGQIVRTMQTPPSSGQQHPKRYSTMRQQQYSNMPPPQTVATLPAQSTQQLQATAPPFMPQQQPALATYGQQQIFDGIDFQQQQQYAVASAAGMIAPPPYLPPPNYGAPPAVLQQYAYQQLLSSLIMQQQHDQMFTQGVADQMAPSHAAYYQVTNQQQTPIAAPMLMKAAPVAAPPVDPCSTDGQRN